MSGSVTRVEDTMEEYHESDYFGSSTMVSGYDNKSGSVNLAKVKAFMDGLNEVSSSLQKTFDLGSAFHSAILEQDLSIVAGMPQFRPKPKEKLTKKAQEEAWLEQAKSDGKVKYIVKESELNQIKQAFETFCDYELATEMVSYAKDVEVSFYDHAKEIKARPDLVGEDILGNTYICNYKTIQDLSKCKSHIYALKYDIRAVHEMLIVREYYSLKDLDYYFLFQEKKAPFCLRAFKLSVEDLDFGLHAWNTCFESLSTARKLKEWPLPELNIEGTTVYRGAQLEV